MKKILLIIVVFNSYSSFAQTESGKDSTAFLDSIFREVDALLDDMMPARNYFSASIGAGTGFFNFKNFSNENFERQKKLMFSPSASFYHKSGFGLSAFGYAVNEEKLNFYQAAVTPSYDYIKRGKWSAGVSYTRYFTKKDLSFYTTPISNEVAAYSTYKRWIIQPALSAAYGWGSKTDYEQHRLDIFHLRRSRNPRVVTIRNEESVRDLSVLLSVRKNFTFMDVLLNNDMFSITPVLALSTGTQNFGFNTSFNSTSKRLNNYLPGNQNINESNGFDAQSVSAIMRFDYSIKKFYAQSQFLLDYFLHQSDQRLNNAFAVIVGVNF